MARQLLGFTKFIAQGRVEHTGSRGADGDVGDRQASHQFGQYRAVATLDAQTVEQVLASQMLWDPIRYDETCPSSDGACALVIVDEDTAKASPNPAWIHGTVMRSEATSAAERDQVNPQASRDAAAALWKQAGITDPLAEIDAAEIYVPFSWFEPMWLESLGFAGALPAH